jgi:hypothetical protein
MDGRSTGSSGRFHFLDASVWCRAHARGQESAGPRNRMSVRDLHRIPVTREP